MKRYIYGKFWNNPQCRNFKPYGVAVYYTQHKGEFLLSFLQSPGTQLSRSVSSYPGVYF